MRIYESIEVRNNLSLVLRERGKIVDRRVGHNIWLNLGREYLSQLISLASYGPDTGERDDRIKFMGFGIGGDKQQAMSVSNNPPMSTTYPGTNIQSDTDPDVTALERPVKISGTTDLPPYNPSDVWLASVQVPVTHSTATEVTFKRLFVSTEISFSTFLSVPLSEIMLFTNAADINVYNNTGVAYDTFDTISKTQAFELEVNWTVRF